MPELPEVETVVSGLRKHAINLQITHIHASDEKLAHIAQMTDLIGKTIVSIDRRGKFINFLLDDRRVLQIHLMMSGRLFLRHPKSPEDPWTRFLITLTDGFQIRLSDPRRFGLVSVLSNHEYILFQHRLGPEPLSREFTTRLLAKRLANRKIAIKSALLDQTIIAGIGNIYADEALWHARVHPETPAGSATPNNLKRLHRGIRRALKEGLEHGGTTFGIYANAVGQTGNNQQHLNVFRRTDKSCLRCRTNICKVVVGGRSSHYCPKCQAK